MSSSRHLGHEEMEPFTASTSNNPQGSKYENQCVDLGIVPFGLPEAVRNALRLDVSSVVETDVAKAFERLRDELRDEMHNIKRFYEGHQAQVGNSWEESFSTLRMDVDQNTSTSEATLYGLANLRKELASLKEIFNDMNDIVRAHASTELSGKAQKQIRNGKNSREERINEASITVLREDFFDIIHQLDVDRRKTASNDSEVSARLATLETKMKLVSGTAKNTEARLQASEQQLNSLASDFGLLSNDHKHLVDRVNALELDDNENGRSFTTSSGSGYMRLDLLETCLKAVENLETRLRSAENIAKFLSDYRPQILCRMYSIEEASRQPNPSHFQSTEHGQLELSIASSQIIRPRHRAHFTSNNGASNSGYVVAGRLSTSASDESNDSRLTSVVTAPNAKFNNFLISDHLDISTGHGFILCLREDLGRTCRIRLSAINPMIVPAFPITICSTADFAYTSDDYAPVIRTSSYSRLLCRLDAVKSLSLVLAYVLTRLAPTGSLRSLRTSNAAYPSVTDVIYATSRWFRLALDHKRPVYLSPDHMMPLIRRVVYGEQAQMTLNTQSIIPEDIAFMPQLPSLIVDESNRKYHPRIIFDSWIGRLRKLLHGWEYVIISLIAQFFFESISTLILESASSPRTNPVPSDQVDVELILSRRLRRNLKDVY